MVFPILPGLDENPIDRFVVRNLRHFKIFDVSNETRTFYWTVIEKVVLSLNDQQLVTGIAILILGLIKHCSISVYHFTLISDLAWLSSSVNLTSLSMLRIYLQDRSQLRNWRVCLMLITFSLLLAYSVMEGHIDWYQSFSYEAQCVVDDLIGNIHGLPAGLMAVDIVSLVLGYGSALIEIYQGPSDAFASWTQEKPIRAMRARILQLKQKGIGNPDGNLTSVLIKAWFLVIAYCLIAIEAVYTFLATVLGSSYVSVITASGWIGYGIQNIVMDRRVAQLNMDGNENDMTFGQLVPILLLSSIILTFQEAYNGKSSSSESMSDLSQS